MRLHLFAILGLAYFGLSSNYNSPSTFEQDLNKITAAYLKQFAELKGTEKPGNMFSKAWDSKVKLEGSTYSQIEETIGFTTFAAGFGSFNSADEAKKKYYEILGKIKKCSIKCCKFELEETSKADAKITNWWILYPTDNYGSIRMRLSLLNLSKLVDDKPYSVSFMVHDAKAFPDEDFQN